MDYPKKLLGYLEFSAFGESFPKFLEKLRTRDLNEDCLRMKCPEGLET